MNADMGYDLGTQGVIVLGAASGDIGLVVDLLVVPLQWASGS